MLMWKRKRD